MVNIDMKVKTIIVRNTYTQHTHTPTPRTDVGWSTSPSTAHFAGVCWPLWPYPIIAVWTTPNFAALECKLAVHSTDDHRNQNQLPKFYMVYNKTIGSKFLDQANSIFSFEQNIRHHWESNSSSPTTKQKYKSKYRIKYRIFPHYVKVEINTCSEFLDLLNFTDLRRNCVKLLS